MPTTHDIRHLDSIDDYLGPADNRFFGAGYRGVRYGLRDLAVDGDLAARATVAATYPRDWSRKADGVDLRPHLSTIDALILGARVAELVLARAQRLSPAQRRATWLRGVTLRAGTAPFEDGLDAIPVRAALRSTGPADDPGSLASVLDARVGTITARLSLVHPVGGQDGADTPLAALDARPELRLFGDGYRHRRQLLERVEVDPYARRAVARMTMEAVDGAVPPAEGLEADHAPSVSFVDSFVCALQLGQVLLYELDGLDRATSNTLWMRHTSIAAVTPDRPAVGPLPVSAALEDVRLLPAKGAMWRTATVVGTCHGVQTRCAVTHQLPEAFASPVPTQKGA